MSVGSIKKLLLVLNLLSLGLVALVGWSFLSHRSEMREPAERPVFQPKQEAGAGERIGGIDNVTMKLGRFPEPVAATEAKPEEAKQESIESVLANIGTIVAAIVVYPPYEPDGLRPVIIFELKGQGGKRMAVGLNEGLVSRPHPDPALAFHKETVPVAYQFVGCEPDLEHPGRTNFLFDMHCDGKEIQKASWQGEAPPKQHKAAAADDPNAPPYQGSGKGFYIGNPDRPPAKPEPVAEPDGPTETVAVETPPVAPPLPLPVPGNPGVPERLFDEEEGVLAPTHAAVEYLRENYNDLLKDARTTTYVDPTTRQARGIQVLGIKSGSMANKFGVLADDVILSINGRPVTRQAEAVNIVKSELNNNKTTIQVKILRRGREITQTYDTRDPDVRRNARDLIRKRGR